MEYKKIVTIKDIDKESYIFYTKDKGIERFGLDIVIKDYAISKNTTIYFSKDEFVKITKYFSKDEFVKITNAIMLFLNNNKTL